MDAGLVKIKNGSLFLPGDKSRRFVLRNINLEISAGCHLAVAGSNGAGKSTLLDLLGGRLVLAEGDILWQEEGVWSSSRITGQAMCQLVTPHLHMACQSHAWDVGVAEFIANKENSLACRTALAGPAHQKACALLESMDALNLMGMRLPQLSRGQLRLVLITRALLRKPKILLLDEWNSGLDACHSMLVEKMLADHAQAMTMVFTGHRAASFPGLVKKRIYLEAGRLSREPEFAESDFQEGRIGSACPPSPLSGEPALPVYELKDVDVYVNRNRVLESITWTMRIGENWRISGANGSGKSTFLRLLAGVEHWASGGVCRYFSSAQGEIASIEARRKRIRLVSDLSEADYDYPLTVLETVLSGLDGTIGLWRDYQPAERESARKLLGIFFGAQDIADISIRCLSTGQLRKVFLARALIGKPELLLLDEPFAGLDRESRNGFREQLNWLALGFYDDLRPQVVIVSHHDEDIPDFVNRQALLREGKLEVV